MPSKRKHEKQAKPRRARGIPIQVYVSAVERTQLLQLTRRRDVSVSDLVRVWIRRAIAASAPKSAAAPRDPRQAEMFPEPQL